MKKIIITTLSLLTIGSALFSSCSKSSTTSTPTAPANNAAGYWFGSFKTSIGLTGNEGELVKSDGTTVQYDFYGTSSTDTATCPLKAYGTYTLSNDTLNFHLNYSTINETFDEVGIINTSVSPDTMAGTFTGSGTGTFSLTKQ
jgi:hypothetical protein